MNSIKLLCDDQEILVESKYFHGEELYLDVDPDYVSRIKMDYEDDPYSNKTYYLNDYIIFDQEYIDERIKMRELHEAGKCEPTFCDCDQYKYTDKIKWLERLYSNLGICLSVSKNNETKEFYTRKSTLMKCEYFKSLFSGNWTVSHNIEEDPEEFRQLLKCLRGHTSNPGPLGEKYIVPGGKTIIHSSNNIIEWADDHVTIISPGIVTGFAGGGAKNVYESSLIATSDKGYINSNADLTDYGLAIFKINLNKEHIEYVEYFKFVTNGKIKKIMISFGGYIIFNDTGNKLLGHNLTKLHPIYNHGVGEKNPRGDYIVPSVIEIRVECIKGVNPLWVQLIYHWSNKQLLYCDFPKSVVNFNDIHLIHQEEFIKSNKRFPNADLVNDFSGKGTKCSLIYSRMFFEYLGVVDEIFLNKAYYTYKTIDIGLQTDQLIDPTLMFASPKSDSFHILFKEGDFVVKAINFNKILGQMSSDLFSVTLPIEEIKGFEEFKGRIKLSEPVETWIQCQDIVQLY